MRLALTVTLFCALASLSAAREDRLRFFRKQTTYSIDVHGDLHTSVEDKGQLEEDGEEWSNNGERTLLFLKMNENIYPNVSWAEEYHEPIFQQDSNFAGRPKTRDGENSLRKEERDKWADDIKANVNTGDGGSDTDQAMVIKVFESAKSKIVVFRGSDSMEDFLDLALLYKENTVQLWSEEYAAGSEELLGIKLTEEQWERQSWWKRWFWNGLFISVAPLVRFEFARTLAGVAGVTYIDARKLGYWVQIKKIMRQILPKGNKEVKSVYLTGHSQGGGWAQMVAMWLSKEDAIRYPTYAFDALGIQCVGSSKFPGDFNYGEDHSDHIFVIKDAYTDYTFMDFHVGHVCTYGADPNRISRKWCDQAFGALGVQIATGTMLGAALRQIPVVGPFLDQTFGYYDAARCRYFTHSPNAIHYNILPILSNTTGLVKGDYVTCRDASYVKDQKCPTTPYRRSFAFVSFFAALVIVLTSVINVLCCCVPLKMFKVYCGFCCGLCCKKTKKPSKNEGKKKKRN